MRYTQQFDQTNNAVFDAWENNAIFQAVMLESVEQALNDMASLISLNTELGEPEDQFEGLAIDKDIARLIQLPTDDDLPIEELLSLLQSISSEEELQVWIMTLKKRLRDLHKLQDKRLDNDAVQGMFKVLMALRLMEQAFRQLQSIDSVQAQLAAQQQMMQQIVEFVQTQTAFLNQSAQFIMQQGNGIQQFNNQMADIATRLVQSVVSQQPVVKNVQSSQLLDAKAQQTVIQQNVPQNILRTNVAQNAQAQNQTAQLQPSQYNSQTSNQSQIQSLVNQNAAALNQLNQSVNQKHNVKNGTHNHHHHHDHSKHNHQHGAGCPCCSPKVTSMEQVTAAKASQKNNINDHSNCGGCPGCTPKVTSIEPAHQHQHVHTGGCCHGH